MLFYLLKATVLIGIIGSTTQCKLECSTLSSWQDKHRRDKASDGLTSNIMVKNKFKSAYLFTSRFHGIFVNLLRRALNTISVGIRTVDRLNGDAGDRVFVVPLSTVVAHGDMKRKWNVYSKYPGHCHDLCIALACAPSEPFDSATSMTRKTFMNASKIDSSRRRRRTCA
jgi:hypothetical protein